jgi:hypothetical protein
MATRDGHRGSRSQCRGSSLEHHLHHKCDAPPPRRRSRTRCPAGYRRDPPEQDVGRFRDFDKVRAACWAAPRHVPPPPCPRPPPSARHPAGAQRHDQVLPQGGDARGARRRQAGPAQDAGLRQEAQDQGPGAPTAARPLGGGRRPPARPQARPRGPRRQPRHAGLQRHVQVRAAARRSAAAGPRAGGARPPGAPAAPRRAAPQAAGAMARPLRRRARAALRARQPHPGPLGQVDAALLQVGPVAALAGGRPQRARLHLGALQAGRHVVLLLPRAAPLQGALWPHRQAAAAAEPRSRRRRAADPAPSAPLPCCWGATAAGRGRWQGAAPRSPTPPPLPLLLPRRRGAVRGGGQRPEARAGVAAPPGAVVCKGQAGREAAGHAKQAGRQAARRPAAGAALRAAAGGRGGGARWCAGDACPRRRPDGVACTRCRA